ncbi:hypothetical protein ACFSCW_09510 [Sphingomonas tabacisoli]|uniref:Inner membrane protein n=1 Tax=Sphingomonas tabacisoli TaxID=2249466 RepID=A0ABW4I3P1_9SPHN
MKAAFGCIASIAYFALVALFMLGNMLGDCFPEMGDSCPTDHERNVTILGIFFGGIAVYGVLAWITIRLTRRNQDLN